MHDENLMSYADAIQQGLYDAMQTWPETVLIGEGVPDPKEIFGTTNALQETFGSERVLDMPIAENGMTGICIGIALAGMKPIMVHQRIDFVLLALDQIINNAAKWHYMFNGQQSVPLVVRLIVGRGWGQGPQHSQSLQKIFTLIPGLKVFMPVTASDAYHMMIKAVADSNPVLYIEHRWLHPVKGHLNKQAKLKLEQAEILKKGNDVTVVVFSYMLVEVMKAAEYLEAQGIQLEIVSVRYLTEIDIDTVQGSLLKTGHLIIADNACEQASLGHEIISKLCCLNPQVFSEPPQLIAWPNHPVPTSPYLAESYYPGPLEVTKTVYQILKLPYEESTLKQYFLSETPSDVPDISFTGPF